MNKKDYIKAKFELIKCEYDDVIYTSCRPHCPGVCSPYCEPVCEALTDIFNN